MIDLIRTNSSDPDFQMLVTHLDSDLKIRDGEEHSFYSQFNKIDSIRNVIIAFREGKAVGCGAFKHYGEDTAEIKRMFVHSEYRGQGIAQSILHELEKWAAELNYSICILETGIRQPEAIRLYEKAGYSRIPNYGQYEHVENSVCMRKEIVSSNKIKPI
jgi:GNAT superfamily N-acetyltransferase